MKINIDDYITERFGADEITTRQNGFSRNEANLRFFSVGSDEMICKLVGENEKTVYEYIKREASDIIPPTLIECYQSCGAYFITQPKFIDLVDYFNSNIEIVGGNSLNDKAFEIMSKVKELINELHRMNIQHNDVKFDNFVYDEREDRLYIIDFETAYFSNITDENDLIAMIEMQNTLNECFKQF